MLIPPYIVDSFLAPAQSLLHILELGHFTRSINIQPLEVSVLVG